MQRAALMLLPPIANSNYLIALRDRSSYVYRPDTHYNITLLIITNARTLITSRLFRNVY